MSKKSAFSHQNLEKEKNEFAEKEENEEDENEDDEQNDIIIEQNTNDKKGNNQKEKKIHEDPFDYSDDEDEIKDNISDLNAIPNFFEIPKPVNLFKPPLPPGATGTDNPLLKKYAPLDWKTAFPISYNSSWCRPFRIIICSFSIS